MRLPCKRTHGRWSSRPSRRARTPPATRTPIAGRVRLPASAGRWAPPSGPGKQDQPRPGPGLGDRPPADSVGLTADLTPWLQMVLRAARDLHRQPGPLPEWSVEAAIEWRSGRRACSAATGTEACALRKEGDHSPAPVLRAAHATATVAIGPTEPLATTPDGVPVSPAGHIYD